MALTCDDCEHLTFTTYPRKGKDFKARTCAVSARLVPKGRRICIDFKSNIRKKVIDSIEQARFKIPKRKLLLIRDKI